MSHWHLTARQYGEVVLPDASTGQGPGSLAEKLSRCKEGMARVFTVMIQLSGLYECRGTIKISYC
jgi:hypothetical protein